MAQPRVLHYLTAPSKLLILNKAAKHTDKNQSGWKWPCKLEAHSWHRPMLADQLVACACSEHVACGEWPSIMFDKSRHPPDLKLKME